MQKQLSHLEGVVWVGFGCSLKSLPTCETLPMALLRVIQTCTGSVHGNYRGNDDLQELDDMEFAPLSPRCGH